MRRVVWASVALLIVATATGLYRQRASRAPVTKDLPAVTAAATSGEEPAASHRGRVAPPADPARVAIGRRLMGAAARDEACADYGLVTDAAPDLAWLCTRIAAGLDETYRRRFGVEPVGPPAGTVLLFSEGTSFRRFVEQAAGLRAGYAGFSSGWWGIVALHADGRSSDEVATTLAHELTHLVNRRALGPGLPPWLSEGLADAIGDAADAGGLRASRDSDVAVQAGRLLGAREVGGGRRLDELVRLEREEFDRGVRSFDYEKSALFVRYLLGGPAEARALREFLSAVAAGAGPDAEQLRGRLGRGWPELEADFERWVEGLGRG